MNSGDTFLFLDGQDDHLWMVISDTTQDPEKLVIVRFLSWQEKYDQACVLNGGEHPFIKHATCVDYPAAKIASNAVLEQLRASNKLKLKAPLSQQLLDLIREKSISGDIITECIALLGEQGLVDYP
jgi:hypothetical protein